MILAGLLVVFIVFLMVFLNIMKDDYRKKEKGED